MIFDFDKFTEVAASVYNSQFYSFEECLQVFRCYFTTYEHFMGKPHPPIRAAQIFRIMQEMPYVITEDRGGNYMDVSPEDYKAMIHQHFNTKYRKCDYNINHFFSGRIRELRFYETCY